MADYAPAAAAMLAHRYGALTAQDRIERRVMTPAQRQEQRLFLRDLKAFEKRAIAAGGLPRLQVEAEIDAIMDKYPTLGVLSEEQKAEARKLFERKGLAVPDHYGVIADAVASEMFGGMTKPCPCTRGGSSCACPSRFGGLPTQGTGTMQLQPAVAAGIDTGTVQLVPLMDSPALTGDAEDGIELGFAEFMREFQGPG